MRCDRCVDTGDTWVEGVEVHTNCEGVLMEVPIKAFHPLESREVPTKGRQSSAIKKL